VSLTASQSNVLFALRRVCADGWPASVREVAAEAGLASTQTAHARLCELGELGYAETNPRQATRRGGWRPTAAGLRQPTPGLS
jgi:SOS-response transcriptional repressor LexA